MVETKKDQIPPEVAAHKAVIFLTYSMRNTPLTQRSQSGLCRRPGIVWEPITKRAHTQLVKEHSVTVVSAR